MSRMSTRIIDAAVSSMFSFVYCVYTFHIVPIFMQSGMDHIPKTPNTGFSRGVGYFVPIVF